MICILWPKKKKSQLRPGGTDKKSHPAGLPEKDILMRVALCLP